MAGLVGDYRVRPTPAARHDVEKLFPRIGDQMHLRRHALKLAYWPASPRQSHGAQVLDLDWEWIKGMPSGIRDVGEVRIEDEIGGHRNLRLIFFKGNPEVRDPLPMIWILEVFPKKRNDFTDAQKQRFKLRRQWVVSRYYAGG